MLQDKNSNMNFFMLEYLNQFQTKCIDVIFEFL